MVLNANIHEWVELSVTLTTFKTKHLCIMIPSLLVNEKSTGGSVERLLSETTWKGRVLHLILQPVTSWQLAFIVNEIQIARRCCSIWSIDAASVSIFSRRILGFSRSQEMAEYANETDASGIDLPSTSLLCQRRHNTRRNRIHWLRYLSAVNLN